MAREGGGGGGAFGWTLLGILVGVAGTLAVETLLSHQQARQVEEQTHASSANVVVAPAPVAPKPVEKPVLSAAPPQKSQAAAASQEDVEDDAAAAGMTSRSHPDQSQPGPAGAPN
jgi:hypothetical protein